MLEKDLGVWLGNTLKPGEHVAHAVNGTHHTDDTKLFSKVNSKEEADLLQNDLNELLKWGGDWQMGFKIDKCIVMHLGQHRNKECNYSMASSDYSDTDRIDLEKTVLRKDVDV